jgi:hypothetical protein
MESLCWTRQVMNKEDQIRSLVVAIEDKENIIRKLTAEVGNLEVQNADYSQIVEELSDKLKLYESKYGTVFKAARNTSDQK